MPIAMSLGTTSASTCPALSSKNSGELDAVQKHIIWPFQAEDASRQPGQLPAKASRKRQCGGKGLRSAARDGSPAGFALEKATAWPWKLPSRAGSRPLPRLPAPGRLFHAPKTKSGPAIDRVPHSARGHWCCPPAVQNKPADTPAGQPLSFSGQGPQPQPQLQWVQGRTGSPPRSASPPQHAHQHKPLNG